METVICAVVVTYNRRDLLRRCLDAILAQTSPISEIIVVNNGSSDGTKEMLAEYYAETVTRIDMRENVGGAGGFHLGMEWACKSNAEWMWLMDDDGVPAADCAAALIACARRGDLSIVNPVVIDQDDASRLAFGLMIGHEEVHLVGRLNELQEGNLLKGEICPFNGTLINRKAVDAIGHIKAEMFIWGDEVEYSRRSQKYGLKIGTALDARHYHPPKRSQTVKSRLLGTFSICAPERAHIYFRNFGFISANYRGTLYTLLKGITYYLFLLLHGYRNQRTMFVRYYLDGVLDRYVLTPSRTTLGNSLREFEYTPKAKHQE